MGPREEAAAHCRGNGGSALNFTDFIAIDWSGQAVERPKGLAVARASAGSAAPELVERAWSRQDIADWLAGLARSDTRALIGLDLSPAFPMHDEGAYFPGWDLSPPDGPALWKLVDELSAADPHLRSEEHTSELQSH